METAIAPRVAAATVQQQLPLRTIGLTSPSELTVCSFPHDKEDATNNRKLEEVFGRLLPPALSMVCARHVEQCRLMECY